MSTPTTAGGAPSRIAPWLVAAALVWLAQATWFGLVHAGLGFPDGHLTDLARARKQLYPWVVGICVLGGAVSAWLATRAARAGVTPRGARVALAALPVVTAVVWAADGWLAATLDDGAGG